MNRYLDGGASQESVNQYSICLLCLTPLRRIWTVSAVTPSGWSNWFHATLSQGWQCEYWERQKREMEQKK